MVEENIKKEYKWKLQGSDYGSVYIECNEKNEYLVYNSWEKYKHISMVINGIDLDDIQRNQLMNALYGVIIRESSKSGC